MERHRIRQWSGEGKPGDVSPLGTVLDCGNKSSTQVGGTETVRLHQARKVKRENTTNKDVFNLASKEANVQGKRISPTRVFERAARPKLLCCLIAKKKNGKPKQGKRKKPNVPGPTIGQTKVKHKTR